MSSVAQESRQVVFLKLALKSLFFTVLWLPVYALRCLVIQFLVAFKPNYGKILDCYDSCVEENYVRDVPQNTIVFTMLLKGDLTVKELQKLFTRHVLEAKISNKDKGQDEIRYPEFKQYQVDVAGFCFWKDDPKFNIANHITEQPYTTDFKSIPKLHQEMIDKKYDEDKSPWEIVVVRNYETSDQTLLYFRCHHTLGDTKSLLKVIVECLGEKDLKLPNVQYKSYSLLDKIRYYVLLPFYFVYCQMVGMDYAVKGKETPWFYKQQVEPPLNIEFTPKMSLNEIKAIAKKNNVTTSAVIMAVIAGGIAKSDSRLKDCGEIPCQYVLPKPGHPDKLANHSYSGTMALPTNIVSPLELLKKCNNIFLAFKTSNLYKYDKVLVFQYGTWFNPLRLMFLKNTTYPLILTNIASDGEGFKIGSKPCVDFAMTCAPCPGVCGVIICPFSYKDTIEISVTAKEGILDEAENRKLVDLMAKEFENLKRL